MEFVTLKGVWESAGVQRAVENHTDWKMLTEFYKTSDDFSEVLLSFLVSIGVVERRKNGKINIPDIFRVDAGIKRKGGVRPPKVARQGQ